MINELCRHNYGHRNLGHGRFRPEVLRHWYFYMMGVMGCVHKLNSRMFHTAKLGEILFSVYKLLNLVHRTSRGFKRKGDRVNIITFRVTTRLQSKSNRCI